MPLYRNAGYLILSSILSGLVGLAYWIIAARLYSTEAIGLGSAVISIIMLLALLSNLGLDYSLVRFLSGSGSDTDAMVNSSFTISGLAAVIIALVFIAGLDLWSPALLLLRQHPVYFLAFLVINAGYAIYLLANRVYIAHRRTSFSLAHGIIYNLLRLPLLVILAGFFASFGIVGAMGIGVLAAVASGLFLFIPRMQPDYHLRPMIDFPVVGRMVRYSVANYIAALFLAAPRFILPVMVVNLLGAEANAYFYISWMMISVFSEIPFNISMSLFAEGSYRRDRLVQDTKRSLKFTFSLIIPVVTVIMIFSNWILKIFGTSYAENGSSLLRVCALTLIPLSLNQLYFGIKRVEMKMKNVVYPTVFIAVATLVISWVTLPKVGIVGVGIAWLIGQGVVALAICIISLYHFLKPD